MAFIGLAGYLSSSGYFVYGTFQMISVIATAVGIGFCKAGYFWLIKPEPPRARLSAFVQCVS